MSNPRKTARRWFVGFCQMNIAAKRKKRPENFLGHCHIGNGEDELGAVLDFDFIIQIIRR